jgi:hypothetical protein
MPKFVQKSPKTVIIALAPGVDVMITNLCDFCQFLAKNWHFYQNPMFMIKRLINLAFF